MRKICLSMFIVLVYIRLVISLASDLIGMVVTNEKLRPIDMHKVDILHECDRVLLKSELNKRFNIGNGIGVAQAVLWLEGKREEHMAFEPKIVSMIHRDCLFFPFIQVANVGDTIVLRNESSTACSFRVSSKRNWSATFIQRKDAPTKFQIVNEEVPISIQCERHPWSRCFIVALDDKRNVQSQNDGRFHFVDVAESESVIRGYHPMLGSGILTVNPLRSENILILKNGSKD